MALKVVKGKNGMLFLDNDTNGVMRQITGAMRAGRHDLAALRRTHRERHALCAALGARYRHVICPNKESVAVDELPDRYRYEGKGPSYVSQYLADVTEAPPFYDRMCLMGRRGAYYRTDSHWTDVGALAYLQAALHAFGDRRALDRLVAMGPQEVPVERSGDLGRKLGWPPESALGVRLANRSCRVELETDLGNEGFLRWSLSPAPENAGERALVLHDSFTTPLYRFLGECYAEALFLHAADLDPRFLARFRPSVVWFIQAERFLPRVPSNDIDYVAFVAANEARKGRPPRGSTFLRETWPVTPRP